MKTFTSGLAAACLIYAVIFGFLWLHRGNTLADREANLASETVAIERESGPAVSGHTITHEATNAAHGEDHHAVETEQEPVMDPLAEHAASLDDGSLEKAPLEGLYEDTLDGRLPVIRAGDQMTPFNAYRRPYTPAQPGQPTIAIAVMDVGISETASKSVMSELSPEVSVIVSPYALAPDFWLQESRLKGHEVWMKLPVETDLYPMDDPGPQTLLINAMARQNLTKLTWSMTRGSGYAGLVTGHEPSFMKSVNDVRPVMEEIFKRGLGFVDGETNPARSSEMIAAGVNAPYDNADVWIDIPSTPEHIAASLRQLEVLAQSNGSAIGFVHSTPLSLKIVQNWIDGLPQKGVAIAPLSAVVQMK